MQVQLNESKMYYLISIMNFMIQKSPANTCNSLGFTKVYLLVFSYLLCSFLKEKSNREQTPRIILC